MIITIIIIGIFGSWDELAILWITNDLFICNGFGVFIEVILVM